MSLTHAQKDELIAAMIAEQAELIAAGTADAKVLANAKAQKVVKLAAKDGFIPVMADGTKAKPTAKPAFWVGRDPRSGKIVFAQHNESTRSPRQSKATYGDDHKVPANAYSGMKALNCTDPVALAKVLATVPAVD